MLPSKSSHLPPCHCQPRWKAMVIFRGNCRSSSGHLALWRLGQRSPEVHPALPSAQSPHRLPSSQATPCADSRPRGPGPGLVWPLLPQRPRALPLALCGVPQASAQFRCSASLGRGGRHSQQGGCSPGFPPAPGRSPLRVRAVPLLRMPRHVVGTPIPGPALSRGLECRPRIRNSRRSQT